MESQNFESMSLSAEISHALVDLGFEEATPIQSQAIEIIMSGKDVIGQSQTGTGKTAAFGIPCLEKIDPDNRHLQAVILTPTRELAIQICEEFRKLLKYKDNIRVVPIYGGQPIDRQIFALKKGAHVIIGTPGRVMDHMERRTLKMETVTTVILDEADEMLDMGFREDIETILGKMPEERQTILFSATMPNGILSLTKNYQKNPEHIRVIHKELTVPKIEQIYYEVTERIKLDATCRIIDMENPDLSLIFCNTKKKVDELVDQLQARGYFAEGLHGDLKQIQRDNVMKKFRNQTLEILVATDVAARGIDVNDIDIVFNYDLPQDEEYYVHRVGRTARAGKSGKAITFVVGKEIYKLKDIMHFTKCNIIKKKLPTLNDIEQSKTSKFIEKVKHVIDEGHLSKYVNYVDTLVGMDYSSVEISAALMKMCLHDDKETADDIDFERELEKEYSKPKKIKKDKFDKSGKYNDSKMMRLFMNAGKKHKVRVQDVVGVFAAETGLPGKIFGAIDIYDDFTFVDVPEQYVKEVISGMKNKKIKGAKVNVEQAQVKAGKKKSSKEW